MTSTIAELPNKVRFPTPVQVGARMRLTATLGKVDEVAGGLQLTVTAAIDAQGAGKPGGTAEPVFHTYN